MSLVATALNRFGLGARPTDPEPTDPKRWAILYLGSVKAEAVLPGRDIVVVNKNGNPVDHQVSALREIEGLAMITNSAITPATARPSANSHRVATSGAPKAGA